MSKGRVQAVTAWILAASSIVVITMAVPHVLRVGGDAWFMTTRFLTASSLVVGAAIGGLVASRRPANPVGWLLLVGVLARSISWLAQFYGHLSSDPAPSYGARAAEAVSTVVGILGAFVLFVALVLVFPNGRLPSRRWRPLAVFGVLICLGIMLRIFAPSSSAFGFGSPPFEFGPARALAYRLVILNRSADIWWIAYVLLFTAAVAAPLTRMIRARGDLRQQMRWFAFAGGLLLLVQVAQVIRHYAGIEDANSWRALTIASSVAGATFFAAIGLAVLKYRLYDIDVVLRRTVRLGCLVAVIALAQGAATAGVGSFVGERAAQGPAGSFTATALVAAFVQPVRRRSERLADRLVYGQRSTPYALLAGFTQQVSGVVSLDDALAVTAESIGRGFGARRVFVRVFVGDSGERRDTVGAEWPDGAFADASSAGSARIVLPVEHDGDTVGEIEVVKRSGDRVSSADRDLLVSLTSQIGRVLSGVRLTTMLRVHIHDLDLLGEGLAASRRRLVTAHLEARRRFEVEVRTSVSPHLDAVTTALREAQGEAAANRHDVAARALREAVDAAESALEEVRRLARGISDPVLRDRGLAASLESFQARGTLRLITEVPSVLSPEASSTLHACVVEAATGGVSTVGLRRRDDDIELELVPGTPLPSATLSAVADRVEAVGGTAVFEPGRVLVRVPDRVVLSPLAN